MADGALNRAVQEQAVPYTWKAVTAAASLAVRDTNVKVTIPDVADFNITLPPAPEAQGRIYTIKCLAAAGGHKATVVSYESDGSGKVYTSAALSAANDVLILFSDGEEWYALHDVTT